MTPTPVTVYGKKFNKETCTDVPDSENCYRAHLIDFVVVANYTKCVVVRCDTGFIETVNHEYVQVVSFEQESV